VQQGSEPVQQAVNGAATAPKAIQVSSAKATNREQETETLCMRLSLSH
jgi:hypothetical protein